MFKLIFGLLACLACGAVQAKSIDEMFPDARTIFTDEAYAAMSRLDFQQGTVQLGAGLAEMTLGEEYYFLNPEDSGYVLVELWGNPPGEQALGMVFPSHLTPLDDAWGILITYEDIGYVSDEDAEGYDYDSLLEVLQDDQRENNKWRIENGYPAIEVIGWAAPPRYNKELRSLYWAKQLSFADSDTDTLNYNIRVLGRRGVLVLNFIAGMYQLEEVDAAVPGILAATRYTEGNRYADFDPSIDTVAAVGIGGLIAGKVLTKTGLLAVALVFLKKFWFLLLLPLFWLKNLFIRRRDE